MIHNSTGRTKLNLGVADSSTMDLRGLVKELFAIVDALSNQLDDLTNKINNKEKEKQLK